MEKLILKEGEIVKKNFLEEVKSLSEKKSTAKEEYEEKLDEIQIEYLARIIKEHAALGENSVKTNVKIGKHVIDEFIKEGFEIRKKFLCYEISWNNNSNLEEKIDE